MTHKLNGKFIVIEGLDGIGKGEAANAIVDYLKQKGLRILDLREFWQNHHTHPDFINSELSGKPNPYYLSLDDFDVMISAEPTYIGIGLAIREEIIAKNSREYSPRVTAECYSNDRLILHKRVLLPALKAGKIIVQERNVASSIVYQPLQSTKDPITVKEVIGLEGNAFTLEHAPDLLLITTISDVSQVIERLKKRVKDDNAVFEELEFQLKLKPIYEGDQLKDIFESQGTTVKFLDTGTSIEETRRQAIEIFKSFYKQ
jgi:thymidylate kinase